jgi:outer membrane protein assembly factor BamB
MVDSSYTIRMLRLIGCFLLIAATARAAADAPRLVPSPEPGWPQFRGPRRDGISLETGLLKSWPEGGPKVLWTATGIGNGYSSPIITRGRIYITGDQGTDLVIHALDLDGKPLWTARNGRSWTGPYPGARAACAAAGERLYHMNAHGRAACFEAATGREVWAVEVLGRFAGKEPTWGMGECLLLDGSRVIVSPGGKKASLAALDARSGETVWASAPVAREREVGEEPGEDEERDSDGTAYASPILLEFAGRRLVIGCSGRHLLGVDAATGKILWKQSFPTTYQVLALTPAVAGGGVFMSAPDSKGGKLLRLHAEGDGVGIEEAWTADLDTCHGGVLPVGDILVGSWYRRFDGFGAIDLATGKTLHRTHDLVMGSALHADGLFYCLAQDGTMALADIDRQELRIVSRFALAKAEKKDAWAHPVILDGRLYLRYHDRLICHDIRRTPLVGENR